MNVTLLEPYYGGSHRQWADQLCRHSRHRIRLLTLAARHWKWRMHGAAVTLARRFGEDPAGAGLIVATDLMDLAVFRALLPPTGRSIPLALYFHENQLTYPWSPKDPDLARQRNHHYGYINFTSALAADRVFFNSRFHRQAFLEALVPFLRQFPDHRELSRVEEIREKSGVLPLGLPLADLDAASTPAARPEEAVLLWNHRWEYDKDPDTFFRILFRLRDEGVPFRLVVLGASYRQSPPVFELARRNLADRILHWGYVENRQAYAAWLQLADILPVTSRQDFFGAAVVEAIYCQCYPLLPHRLAFPEHIPEARRADHLYEDEETLYRKLKALIGAVRQIREGKGFRHFVAHYDWRILAGEYDRIFEQLPSLIQQKPKP